MVGEFIVSLGPLALPILGGLALVPRTGRDGIGQTIAASPTTRILAVLNNFAVQLGAGRASVNASDPAGRTGAVRR